MYSNRFSVSNVSFLSHSRHPDPVGLFASFTKVLHSARANQWYQDTNRSDQMIVAAVRLQIIFLSMPWHEQFRKLRWRVASTASDVQLDCPSDIEWRQWTPARLGKQHALRRILPSVSHSNRLERWLCDKSQGYSLVDRIER